MKLSIKFFRRKLPQKFDKSAKKSCSGELKCFYYQPTFRLHAASYLLSSGRWGGNKYRRVGNRQNDHSLL